MTIESLLKEIEARAEATPQGPWRAVRNHAMGETWFNIFSQDGDDVLAMIGDLSDKVLRCPKAEFIAASRTDIPRLVRMLRKALMQRDYLYSGGIYGPENIEHDNAELLAIAKGERE